MEKFAIHLAVLQDLPKIMKVYEYARCFMSENGNPTQWGTDKPKLEQLQTDISKQQLYVISLSGRICGVFALVSGEDPTYRRIDGAWRKDGPYCTIHRLAGNGTASGIFAACLSFCKEKCGYLRIDTHENNHVMRHLLKKHGFHFCGSIWLQDGSPRLAYDLVIS